MSTILQLIVGSIIGILVGMTGTGGAFIIPALVYIFGFNQLRAQGTALLVGIVPVWAIAFIPYYREQNFDWRIALLLAVGIGFGSYFGASVAQHLPVQTLRRLLGTVLVLIGFRLIVRS